MNDKAKINMERVRQENVLVYYKTYEKMLDWNFQKWCQKVK